MTNTTEMFIKTWPELMFTAVATPKEYYVEYRIYEVAGLGYDDTGNLTVADWTRAGALSTPDSVDNLEEAQLFAHGRVKWDGCSDFVLDEMTSGDAMHHCNRKGLENIGKVLAACWDWTAELIPDKWFG